MPSPAVAIGGGSILSGVIGSNASNRASDAQRDAANQSAELQRRNMLLQANVYEPQRGVGYQALGDLASLYGYNVPQYTNIADLTRIINGGTSAVNLPGVEAGGMSGAIGNGLQGLIARYAQQRAATGQAAATPITAQPAGQPGNLSRFWASPDYEFRRAEGGRGLERSSAARSGNASPQVMRELTKFNSGLASTEFNNYWNRLAQMSGMGQVANQAVGGAAGNYAANAGNALMQAGDARASGIMNQTNAITGSLNNGLNTWLLQRGGWFNAPNSGGGGIVPGGYQWTWPTGA